MFWNKKQEQKILEKQVCNADKNISECSSVLILRECQQQLKDIKNLDLEEILSRGFGVTRDSYLRSEMYCVMNIFQNLINKRYHFINFTSFENRFKRIGKELDDYINQSEKIEELNNKIKFEKEKLGIE